MVNVFSNFMKEKASKVDKELHNENRFYDWKFLSHELINELENASSKESIRSLLLAALCSDIIDPLKSEIVLDFHYNNYIFCKQKAFNARKISTFLSIMKEIFAFDMNNNIWKNTPKGSLDRLQVLLQAHSVERPPRSILVFDIQDTKAILSFVLENYYANYRLYRYIFGQITQLSINQCSAGGIELPFNAFSPLSDAVFIPSGDETTPPS